MRSFIFIIQLLAVIIVLIVSRSLTFLFILNECARKYIYLLKMRCERIKIKKKISNIWNKRWNNDVVFISCHWFSERNAWWSKCKCFLNCLASDLIKKPDFAFNIPIIFLVLFDSLIRSICLPNSFYIFLLSVSIGKKSQTTKITSMVRKDFSLKEWKEQKRNKTANRKRARESWRKTIHLQNSCRITVFYHIKESPFRCSCLRARESIQFHK